MLDRSKNHFELFDLPVGFAVDAKRLAERYRVLQAASHPDRRLAIGEPERAHQATTQVNEAYRTLTDPLARADYLLQLHGEDSGSTGDVARDGGLLLEQMELREVLAQAQSRPNPQAAMATVLTQFAERSAALDKELEGLFADPSAENLEAAREIVRKLQFLSRCRRDAGDLAVLEGRHGRSG